MNRNLLLWPVLVVSGGLLLGLVGCSGNSKPLMATETLAKAQLPVVDKKPFLRIETGMHTAKIYRIAVDKAERFLVTASDDKTARVWDLTTGKLLQILRPPIGEGNEGKLFAVAMSPDGKEVAVGGYTGRDYSSNFHIYFFDRATGRLTRNIAKLPDVVVSHLAYSLDGRYLAAALSSGKGIRIYAADTLTEVGKDSDYAADSHWLDFASDGRLVSSSWDGFIRLYDAQFHLLKKAPAPGGKQPTAVRFSPDGKKIAVGFADSTRVNVLSGDDLSFSYAPDTHDINNYSLDSVAWSTDAQNLYAGGKHVDSAGNFPLYIWLQAGRGAFTTLSGSQDTIMDIRSLSHNRLVYGAADPAWVVLDNKGIKQLEKIPPLAIQYKSRSTDNISLNADGSVVEFISNRQAKRFVLSDPQQSTATLFLTAPKTTSTNLTITDWHGSTVPKLNGRPLSLSENETAFSLAMTNDERHFLLGTHWWLRFYDAQGQQQWQTPTPGVARAVNISSDQRFAVAAFGDGTIRWYSTSDGQEKLAFFPHSDGKRWILWTPEGFYSASPDAEDLIGYHLNQTDAQGQPKEGQFVAVKQLREQFYRPDLIAARLQSNEKPIQQALSEIGNIRTVLSGGLPPQLELIEQQQDGLNLKLKFRVIPQNGGIGKLSYRVNDIEQTDSRGGIHVGIKGLEPIELTVPLTQGRNAISINVGNKDNSITSKPLVIETNVTTAAVKKPALYVLAVGVSEYRDKSLTLNFADKDADAVSTTLKNGGERLFNLSDKQVITLTNANATLENIKQSFAQLAQQVHPEDVFILYLAGHGKVFDGSYHFIPSNAIYSSEKAFRTASLDEAKLRDLLGSIKAQKSVIILDTCYAGKLAQQANVKNLLLASAARSGTSIDEKAAISRLTRATGRAIFAATSDSQEARERDGHGFFTSALLEGLQGKADSDKDHLINILELGGFLGKRVPEITKDQQFPVMETEKLMDFPLGTTQ